MGSKSAKTDLSRAIVHHVYHTYGGRFLKYQTGSAGKTGKTDNDNDSGDHGSYYVELTPAEARKKTSQALRESKQVKWTT